MFAVGVTCLVMGFFVGLKIYKGSKISFAYTMISFTFAYGVVFLARGVIALYFLGPEWSEKLYYLIRLTYAFLSVQGWIFGI